MPPIGQNFARVRRRLRKNQLLCRAAYAGESMTELLKKMGMPARDLSAHQREQRTKSLDLANAELSEKEIIALMVKHPELIQRPIVERGSKAILRRPVENIRAASEVSYYGRQSHHGLSSASCSEFEQRELQFQKADGLILTSPLKGSSYDANKNRFRQITRLTIETMMI